MIIGARLFVKVDFFSIKVFYQQVMSLKQRGIKAEFLGSTQTDQTVYFIAESGKLDLVYMTPEKACSLCER